MRYILSLVLLVTLSSCGPRDDESLLGGGSNRGQGYDLQAGKVLEVTTEGQKLESCREADQPTWDTIRIYKETSFIFDKTDQLKVVVGRGDFNCVPVSSKTAIQIEVQDGTWQKTGDFYFVSKLEMHNLDDFLVKGELVAKTAKDMAMSEDQLRSYLTTDNTRPQITLTYLKPADGSSAASDDDYTLESGYVLSAELDGLKLPTCSEKDDPIWDTLRLPIVFNSVVEKADEVSVIVSNRSRNCVAVSSQKTVEAEFKENEDSDYKGTGKHFLVNKLSLVNREFLLTQTEWMQELATGMQVELENLKTYLQDEEADDVISITYVEASEAMTTPVAPLIQELRFPEAAGQTISECNGNFWSSVRLLSEVKDKVQDQIDNKTLKAILNPSDRNCLKIGSTIGIDVKNENWEPVSGANVKVIGVIVLDKVNFQSIPFFAEKISEEMGLSMEEFQNYVQGLNGDSVNITRLEWVE